MNGNRLSNEGLQEVVPTLDEVRYSNVRRQCMNLFRHYDRKSRGFLGPLGIERIFPRVGIFLFDFQVDRLCTGYHNQGDPGGKNEITESRLLEYLADTRKDQQSGFLHTVWKKGIASSPRAFVEEDDVADFLEYFENKCQEYGELAPHEAVHLLSKPIPPVGRKKPRKSDVKRYKRILKGSADLRSCGLTDTHMRALMAAQKAVPIFHSLDLRKNLLSELALGPLRETLDWHLDVDDLDTENVYCWRCSSVAEFNKKTVNTAFCLACGTRVHRPRYMLWNIRIQERKTTPRMELKWSELGFDEECLAVVSDHLESKERTTREEFEDMVWDVAQPWIDEFAATISTPLVAVTKKDKKAVEEKETLLDHFDKWVKRRFAERYLDMYHQQAVHELYDITKTMCMEMGSKVNNAVHASIPTSTEHILTVTQNFHQLAKEELEEVKWRVKSLMPILYRLLFLSARNIFRHYAAANLDCKPDSVSCGARYSTIAMESGRVVTIGNQDDLIESFKEEILGNLPSRFRKMFAMERVKNAKKYAAEQERAAKMMKEVEAAEEELLQERERREEKEKEKEKEEEETRSVLSRQSRQSGKQSVRSQRSQRTTPSNQDEEEEEMEDKENDENTIPNERASQSHQNQRHSLSRYHHHENEENIQSDSNNQEMNDHPDNHIVFDPMDEDDLAATRNEESDDEENGEGPASPIRYSPVRQSPMRRMTGLSVATATMSLNDDDDEKNKKKKKRTSKLMDHQIPSFVELEPDEYHNGERHSSEPILHARDVLEDPEDFNIVFESILTVFRAGHNHEEDDEVSCYFFWIFFGCCFTSDDVLFSSNSFWMLT